MKHTHGFTVVEFLAGFGIAALVTVAASTLLIYASRYNGVIWNQLSAQSEGRKVIQTMVDDIRKAESSSIGGYPIQSASSTEFIFFSNIDDDLYRERIRYTLKHDYTIQKGVIKPSGTPLQYLSANETTTTLAHFVKNDLSNIPLFSYYTSAYMGTSTPMPKPVTTTLIRVVKVQIELEKDPNKTPVAFRVEGVAHIRNLKEN